MEPVASGSLCIRTSVNSPRSGGGRPRNSVTQASTGDAVRFTPGLRKLTQVTVEVDDWAVYTNPSAIPAGYTAVTPWKGQATGAWPGGGTNPNGPTYSNPRGFYWPLTLDLYTLSTSKLSDVTTPGTYPAAVTPIASVTQTVLIPWQPTPSTSSKCPPRPTNTGAATPARTSPGA